MTDIKKWYSDWYSGEEELTDEEEQSLAELDMMVDKAIADERAKVLSEVLEIVEETMKISYSGSDHVDNIKAKLNQLKGITI